MDIDPAKTPELLAAGCDLARRLAEPVAGGAADCLRGGARPAARPPWACCLPNGMGARWSPPTPMQIYRGMTIGTAAPTAEEMQGVPHHMIAVADPARQWSAARYAQAAIPIVDDILKRGESSPFWWGNRAVAGCGGQGREFAQVRPVAPSGGSWRRSWPRRGWNRCSRSCGRWTRVRGPASPGGHKADPPGAGGLPGNRETITAPTRGPGPPPRYDAVWLGLRFADREDMKALIDRRVDAMVRSGLEEEVRALLQSGLPPRQPHGRPSGTKSF